jgi:predicted DNA-binding protein (UPF0251 family)
MEMSETGSTPRKETHTPGTTPDSAEVQVTDAIRNAGHGFVFEVMHAWGRTTTERRISKRIHKVRWALEFRDGDLTPAQKQALVMVYGAELTPNECAKRLDIARQSFHDRLRSAENTVDRLYARGGRRTYKKGRPNARLSAPQGAEWIELRAREMLGGAAAAVWGDDHAQSPYRLSDEDYREMLRREGTTDERMRTEP